MSGETDFSGWIGKSETEYGVVSAYAANYFTLTLDRDDPLFVDGDRCRRPGTISTFTNWWP